MKKSQWPLEVLTYLLALLFLFTALSKLFDFRHFVRSIDEQPFDNVYTPFLIWCLPASELLAVVFLFWIKTRRVGLWLSLGLMGVFTVYVALVTFHFYWRVPCACAGVFKKLSWPQHLVFNVIFTFFAGIALWLDKRIKDLV
jgi:putative oxidoreductase